MKKITLCAVFAVAAFQGLQAQVMQKNNVAITPYIGVPNAARVLLNASELFDYYDYSYNGTSEMKITGPAVSFGGKLEYMVTNAIGISLEGNYEKTGYEQTINGTYYDPNTGMDVYDTTIVNVWGQTKTRALARFNFHFLNAEKVDLYTGLGLGMTFDKYEHPERTPDESDYNFFAPVVFIDRATDPLAARIFFGTHIMFIPNLGLNMELGLGSGSTFQIGLTGRF